MRNTVAAMSLCMLTSCSVMTTEARLTTKDLNRYQIDCSAEGQKQFIESQRVSQRDEIVNALLIRSWFGYIASINDGTYQERRYIDEGRRSAVQRKLEYDRHKTCRD